MGIGLNNFNLHCVGPAAFYPYDTLFFVIIFVLNICAQILFFWFYLTLDSLCNNLDGVFMVFRFYTIVGPKVLRPNSEYHVAVSTQGTTSPTTVVVDVGGKQDSGGVLKVTQFVKVDPYSTKIVRLEVRVYSFFLIYYILYWR